MRPDPNVSDSRNSKTAQSADINIIIEKNSNGMTGMSVSSTKFFFHIFDWGRNFPSIPQGRAEKIPRWLLGNRSNWGFFPDSSQILPRFFPDSIQIHSGVLSAMKSDSISFRRHSSRILERFLRDSWDPAPACHSTLEFRCARDSLEGCWRREEGGRGTRACQPSSCICLCWLCPLLR